MISCLHLQAGWIVNFQIIAPFQYLCKQSDNFKLLFTAINFSSANIQIFVLLCNDSSLFRSRLHAAMIICYLCRNSEIRSYEYKVVNRIASKVQESKLTRLPSNVIHCYIWRFIHFWYFLQRILSDVLVARRNLIG